MLLKSFFAPTVEAALAQGGRELGPEAMIVQSRRAPAGSRHLGEWEVVLADMRPAAGAAPAAPGGPPAGSNAGESRLDRELGEMRRQMDAMRRLLARSAVARPRWLAPGSGAADIFAMLVEAEVEAGLAERMAEAVAARLGSSVADRPVPRTAAVAEIESRFTVASHLGAPGGASCVVALIGPPGSGKTTTLVKLAVTYGLSARRPVLLLSADNCRIAAAEQMRAYAAIVGVGFELAETARALEQALDMHRAKGLILVDTPGFAAADMDQAAELAHFLSTHPEIDTHLVLSASMKSADLTRTVDRFEIFRPAKLLVTRLDETASLGPMVSEAARTQKPLSFLTTGQQIPEDIEPATRQRIVDLILPPGELEMAVA